jgi:UDP-N-acetylmuramate--alanine ligase
VPREKRLTYSLHDARADLLASDITPAANGVAFTVTERATGARARLLLATPGRHNVSNALAALAAVRAYGVSLPDAAAHLEAFTGVKRRLETIGASAGVTVIDDFAHNPDKITATLATLHDFPGRLLVMFQPHGFGPLRLMKDAFVDCFAGQLAANDVLIMPEPVYFGGTVDRSVTSTDIINGVRARGRDAWACADRPQCGEKLLELARPGDRIIVMGARDDTLSQFAGELVEGLGAQSVR